MTLRDILRSPFRLWHLCALLVVCVLTLGGANVSRGDYALAVPQFSGRPCMTVKVPVTLNNAAEVAGMLVRINYAPQIVTVLGVTPGGLGSQFTLNYTAADGVLTLMATRPTKLVSGSGTIAVLELEVNIGAQDGDFSELAVAQFDLSDETGVKRLDWADIVSVSSGRLTAKTTGMVDNDGDKLPDDWESAFGFDTLLANHASDDDGDGLNNFGEYAFAKNPKLADGPATSNDAVLVDGQRYLRVKFRRRTFGISYRVEESANLVQWTVVDPVVFRLGSVLDHGDGTQTWEVRGTLPLSGTGAVPRAFLRVKALPAE